MANCPQIQLVWGRSAHGVGTSSTKMSFQKEPVIWKGFCIVNHNAVVLMNEFQARNVAQLAEYLTRVREGLGPTPSTA